MTERTDPWQLVIPIKRSAEAKSRLEPPSSVARADLAAAMASDTLAAASAAVGADRVIVVTADEAIGQWALGWGARVVPDPGGGLNAAISLGLRHGGTAVAVLLGDLPALRPQDLSAALRECSRHAMAVVPDADGTGTVLLSTTVGGLTPRFGGGSATAHAAYATRLDLDLPRLRRDVDDRDSLRQVLSMGVGPHTSALLSSACGFTAP